MQFMRCYFLLCALKLPDFVTGQQYNLTGSSKFAELGRAFTLTCKMFLPSEGSVNAVKFYRTLLPIVVIGISNPNGCRTQSAKPNYTYGCPSDYVYTLTIPAENMTKNEQGSRWRCESVANASYKSSDFILLIATDVHNVSLIPDDNPLTIQEGITKEVKCVVNRNAIPSPNITWYLESTVTDSIAETYTSSISILGNRTNNRKILQCRAANSNKSPKTANTSLNIEYPPFVNTLSRQDIVEGKDFLVTCMATQGNPNFTIFFWTMVANQKFIHNGSILSFPKIKRTRSGTYRCTAENNYSNGKHGTDNQLMVVNVFYPPSVNNLSKQDVIEGRNLSVECTAIPGHPNSTRFYWTKEDDQLFIRNGSTLQFFNIQISSSGTYTCAAQNDYQKEEQGTDRQFMIVNVQYPPVVKMLPQQNVIEGSDLSKTCQATPGNPNFTTFYWNKVDNPGFRRNGSTLQLNDIQRTSSGTYRCIAENIYLNEEKGRDSQAMIINVLYQPTIEDIPLQIVNETDIVTLTREISGNPLANVSWYYGSNLLTTQNSVNTTTYDLGRASCTDTKNFTIIAGNGILNKTAAIVELIVNCKPLPDKTNITLGVTDTTGIDFLSTIVAYPAPQYRLEYDNGTINNQMTNRFTRNAINSFTIHFNQTVVKEGDYGIYRLIVSNFFGETTIYVNILPQKKPDNPKSIKVTCDVTSASMQWEASFNGGDQQSFIILAFNGQHGTTISEKINETGKNVYIHGVQNLQPSTLYEFYVSAQNRHGNSSSEKISCTTLEESSASLPLIVGVSSAGVITLAIVFILAVVFLRRFTMCEKQARKSQRFKNEVAENEEENDDGMKENSLYVSAGPKVDEKPEAAVYAAVNKKVPESNNNANVYAEVNKSGHIIAEGAMYSDVKPKKGLFKKDVNRKKDGNPKQKKGKNQKNNQDVADVYENSEDIPMSSKSDNVYSNTGQKIHNKEERGYKNKDGLLYVEVQFDAKTEKGNQTIHGEDEKTDYATVEFPMAASTHDE